MTNSKSVPANSSGIFDESWSQPHPLTSLEDLLPVRVGRLSEIYMRIATVAFSSLDIRVTDLRILNVLHSDDEVSVAEISRRARIDKAWISRLVRELEDKGFVARKPHPTDSRMMLVTLTDAGRDIQSKLLPITVAHENRTLGGVNRQEIIDALDLIERNAIALLLSLERAR